MGRLPVGCTVTFSCRHPAPVSVHGADPSVCHTRRCTAGEYVDFGWEGTAASRWWGASSVLHARRCTGRRREWHSCENAIAASEILRFRPRGERPTVHKGKYSVSAGR
ncbi:hypothetical protein DENSPDRAFT_90336 [Dentipellis sp. KUC8613]|nr:hypothetical protein DENSPDRAFT_90336 [Dentipellis sp. KUC8613]